MEPTGLLAAYQRLHDARDWPALAALFTEQGEIAFHGVSVPPARGPAAIERLFRQRGPDDRLVLGPPLPQGEGRASAVYGWATAPELVEGSLWLQAAGERIARLDVWVRRDGPVLPQHRVAVRALVIAPGPEVLLLRTREPENRATWWITPGGGMDPGEDDRQALQRELLEEVGLSIDALGPCVWTRSHTSVWSEKVHRQVERFYLVKVERAFVPVPGLPPEEVAREGLLDHRWWTLDEFRSSGEVFAPRRLAVLLPALLREGVPAVPIDVGI